MEISRSILCTGICLLHLTLILQSIQWYKVNSIAKCKACSVYLSLKLDAKSYPGRNDLRKNAGVTKNGLRKGLPLSVKLRGMLCLTNLSMCSWYLILLSGDIQLNPGPTRMVKDPCAVCSKGCRTKAILCDCCESWYHTKCIGMSNVEFEKSEGGAVIIYVRSCLKVVPLLNILDADIEGKLIKIERPRCKPMIIGTFYRPPDFDPYKFIEALSNSFTNLDTTKSDIVIMRDFNVDFSSKKGSKLQQSFKSFLLSYDLHQIIEKATRVTEYSETLIDFICVSNKHRVVQWDVDDSHLSDHSIVVCVLKGGVPKTPSRTFEYRSYRKYNKEQFCSDLKEMPWNEIDTFGCIDEAPTHWESLFNRVADKHAPIKKQRVKGFKTPWVTNEVLQLRRERNHHQTKGRKTRSHYHWQMYRKLRNHINRLERRLKSEHFCRILKRTTTTVRVCGNA